MRYLIVLSLLAGCAGRNHTHPNTTLNSAVARQGVIIIEHQNRQAWVDEELRELDKRVTDLETVQK